MLDNARLLANRNVQIEVRQGENVINHKAGDLRFSDATNRWTLKKTGHFVSKEIMSDVLNQIKNQHQPRTLVASIKSTLPKTYQEAINSANSKEFILAMDEEMKSLIKNEVFEEMSDLHIPRKPVGSRWVFAIKYKQNGEIDKFKARIVAKGFSQIYGIDYGETYCSVVHILSTRLLIGHAAKRKLKLRQFDIKTAFLYGSLEEEKYMVPPGNATSNIVWKLKRSLYGLKQSSRMWSKRFTQFTSGYGLLMNDYDNSVFYRLDRLLIVMVYVDDGLIIAQEESDIVDLLHELKLMFEMHEMEVTIYRGVEILMQKRDGILLHQMNYTKKILTTFNMNDSKPAGNPVLQLDEQMNGPLDADTPYRQAVGSLAYLADTTRPDIAFAVNQLARKMANPTLNDWKCARHVFRYLNVTINLGIKFPCESDECMLISDVLVGYSDSDFAGDSKSSKSTTGYIIVELV